MNADELRKQIETHVEDAFLGYDHVFIRAPKAIHDTILETNYFFPHEVAYIDLPIVQRLRHISQTDVASFVFPSGNHNRFEHTLGVATIAGKFVDALFQRNSCLLRKSGRDRDYVYRHCRVAAILHDVGHGPFSHLSEQVYSPSFKEMRKEPPFQGASPHEILSYMIVTSRRMRQFNDDIIKGMYNVEIDLQLVGDIIIGFSLDKPKDVFMVEIVNGAFDADKLDYMLRDSHSTGIRMSLDLSRLLYTLDVVEDNGKIRLSIDIGGVIALEQIVFNKMTLFTTIYHHHKVRATGCLLKSAFMNNKNFASPTDFLKYTDYDVWASDGEEQNAPALRSLKSRKIPKRALVISSRTIKEGIENLSRIMSLVDDSIALKTGGDDSTEPRNKTDGASYIRKIEELIVEGVKEKYGIDVSNCVWIDIPNAPKFKEAITCVVKNFSTSPPHLTLNKIFPIDEWVKAFSQNKWNAYVFTMPEHCQEVSDISKDVLERLFNIEFNDYALSICKLDGKARDVLSHN